MTAVSSPFPGEPHATLSECSQCFKSVKFAIRGDNVPIHDPLTGDMKCGTCKSSRKSIEAYEKERHNRPLMSCGLMAYPLYLLQLCRSILKDERGSKALSKETKSSTLSTTQATNFLYDKCIIHEHVDWVCVDMDTLTSVCADCAQKGSHHDYRQFDKAVPIIREKIANVMTAPLHMRGDASTCSSFIVDKEHKDTLPEQIINANLIQLAVEMDRTVNVLNQLMKQVKDTCTLLCDKVSHLRSLVGEGSLRRRLEMIIQRRDHLFQEACYIYINHPHSMIRIRQVISGTLLEGIKLLGLDAEKNGLLTEKEVLELLDNRAWTGSVVGEEVMILRTLACLKETLEYGGPLLLEMTEESVESVLSQSGSIRDVLSNVENIVKSINIDDINRFEKEEDALLSEVDTMLDEAMKAVPLLGTPQSEHWKKWYTQKEEERKRENTLNAVMEALLEGDGQRKGMTHKTLEYIDKAKRTLSEADSLLIDGIVQFTYHYPLPRLLKAEEKGCTHPKLYHYLGECYRTCFANPIDYAPIATEYYDKAISCGHIPSIMSRFQGFKDDVQADEDERVFAGLEKADVYLLDKESEGYVDGTLYTALAEYYRPRSGRGNDLSRCVEYCQRGIALGHAPSVALLHTVLMSDNLMNHLKRDTGCPDLFETYENGIRGDAILLQIILDVLMGIDIYKQDYGVLGQFQTPGELALHCCDLLTQSGSPRGVSWKGLLYWDGTGGIPVSKSKAMSIWLEADEQGLADTSVYTSGIIPAYMKGQGVEQDGHKALEYCLKALEISDDMTHKRLLYKYCDQIFRRGIPPIERDDSDDDYYSEYSFEDDDDDDDDEAEGAEEEGNDEDNEGEGDEGEGEGEDEVEGEVTGEDEDTDESDLYEDFEMSP